jgi:hypothetical protein
VRLLTLWCPQQGADTYYARSLLFQLGGERIGRSSGGHDIVDYDQVLAIKSLVGSDECLFLIAAPLVRV